MRSCSITDSTGMLDLHSEVNGGRVADFGHQRRRHPTRVARGPTRANVAGFSEWRNAAEPHSQAANGSRKSARAALAIRRFQHGKYLGIYKSIPRL